LRWSFEGLVVEAIEVEAVSNADSTFAQREASLVIGGEQVPVLPSDPENFFRIL
jgi:hypothetical protein